MLLAFALQLVAIRLKIFYTDQYVLPLPPWHRFPMEKYRLLRERVQAEGWRARTGCKSRPPLPTRRSCAPMIAAICSGW